ncbi:hypothetical protein L6452_05463 [Arctium lappa]|uniref:Uncharacterized protein n=1 Tax=Arctium lappa TaxID=4217 RepID=A0ACB9EG75_ARCLA|nr:hypothetical protein L6452_05463 [Arctium lappa]
MMIRLASGRKRSERLMKKNTFSNFTNTSENPLDEDGNEIKPNSDGNSKNGPPVVKPKIEVYKHGSLQMRLIGKIYDQQKKVANQGKMQKLLKLELQRKHQAKVW